MKKRFEETRDIMQEVQAIIESNQSNDVVIKKSYEYFDKLYDKFLKGAQ